MFGLIFAILYVAVKIVFYEHEPISSVEGAVLFLWYWHLFAGAFTVVLMLIWGKGPGIITPVLYLFAIFAFDVADPVHIIVAGALYGVGLLLQLTNLIIISRQN